MSSAPVASATDAAGSGLAPAGPVGPVGPTAPASPAGPVGPIAPTAPASPAGPVGPVGPVGPGKPGGPGGPGMPLGPIGPIGPLSPRGPRGPGGPGGPIGPGRSLPITASHTRSCQRSLGRSQLPQQSCRSFMSFFPFFRFAGKLRQFSLCRRRLCGETLRGKIPSVVRHRRRLRTHERCPFIPCTGLL